MTPKWYIFLDIGEGDFRRYAIYNDQRLEELKRMFTEDQCTFLVVRCDACDRYKPN